MKFKGQELKLAMLTPDQAAAKIAALMLTRRAKFSEINTIRGLCRHEFKGDWCACGAFKPKSSKDQGT